ncbi:DUF4232 domain-containing protein [Streptomyces sp. NBC_01314]|uniref:DUF4232 domain-containing protein n=1 Tax=Streptomyces sp. NBC_01314 TaxID=2903821 RepID=UPI003084EBBC|nr:DUF4232 domain-containing protein [Streptomyces sp. NBC_01314]
MIPIRGRRASRAILVAALTLAVGGCGLSEELDRERDPDRAAPSAPVSPAATDGPEATAACPPSGVRMVPGLVESAMGLRAMGVTLTNCGTVLYTVNGYPAIEVLDEDGEPYADVRVLQGTRHITTGVPDFGPHVVTLKPGESARTELVWRNTVTEADIPAVNALYLRIAPLSDRPAEVITPEGGIDLGNTGRLATTAWAQVTGEGS